MGEPLVFLSSANEVGDEAGEASPPTTPLLIFDPQFVSLVYIVVLAMIGLVMNIAPVFTAKLHSVSGTENKNQLNRRATMICGQIGAGYLSTFLLFYCMLIEKTSLFKAVQVIYAFWFYHQSRIAVNVGLQDPMMMWGSAGVFGFVVVAMAVFSERWAHLTLQVISAIWVTQGPIFIVSPTTANKLWKSSFGNPEDDELTPMATTLDRCFGFWLLSAGINTGALSLGGTVQENIGYSAICCGFWLASGVLTGEFRKAGLDVGTMLIWILFDVYVAYALLA